MSEYLTIPKGCLDRPFTDVVVIRPPENMPIRVVIGLARRLNKVGFLPVLQPSKGESERWDYEKWFPTDYFREIGDYVFTRSAGEYHLNYLINEIGVQPRRRLVRDISIAGGNYLHLDGAKTFIYTYERDADPTEIDDEVSVFKDMGWDLYNIPSLDILLKDGPYREYDLDFLMSVFLGKDGRIHAIAAESFRERVPSKFMAHIISDQEALLGGCNIADLRRGQVLVCANVADAPSVYPILKEYARAKVLQTPRGFLDGGGGPRCSMSSFEVAV